ncbi:hypothetical protein [Planctellipticum variicoloris]|uniref:hypothetical protein n=1 Tax=Planctellipticum variicoloris TaxID=3064265 RepID=UPI003013C584|nr:hypothetical protein SH412_004542 [Planctomycetaceae bacterium SH412]
MPGEESLSGLIYQQRYAHYRVLSQLAVTSAGLSGGMPELSRFVVEGREGIDGPIWDIVFEFSDGSLDLHECKDTAIAKVDRLIFYDRLRRDVATGTSAEKISPVWVTDPNKQTPNALGYQEAVPAAVEDLDFSTLPAELPKRVDSTEKAIQEAVWRLCHFSGDESTPPESEDDDTKPALTIDWPRPCTFAEAKALLLNLRVARHRFDDLDQSIRLLSTGVFSTGTPDSVQAFVTGVVTERVVSEGSAEYTVTEFLQAIGTVMVEHNVEGAMQELMTFAAASGITAKIRQTVWRNLEQSPTTSWPLAERAPLYEVGRSSCLIADMGIGKTVASQLAFELEATHGYPNRTLRVEARALDAERVDALVRLSCMLSAEGPTWIAIDGLDEIPHSLAQHWIRAIPILTSLPNLTVLVTARREVLAVHDWLNDAVSPLHKVDMQPLSTAQVKQAFSDVGLPAPNNPQLIAALRNPFLLSLYADIVASGDMPLTESGEVTAFRVIEEFWKRRVRGISEGQRSVGSSDTSQAAKRKAAAFLGDQTLSGNLTLSCDQANEEAARGIEMLLLEGVIREQGVGSVAWSHEWLREYSLIQTLIARLASLTATSLARVIPADCKEDCVARSAAAAGLKWIIGKPNAGTATDYLTELGQINPGLAREALIVLLEGTPLTGALNQLPDQVLADALTLAVSLRVPQWGDEVAAIDEARFTGTLGNRLHGLAVEYELEVAGGATDAETVQRFVKRDLLRWKAGCPSSLRTVRMLLEATVASHAYGVSEVDEWLIVVGSASNVHLFGRMLDAIAALLSHGDIRLACTVFRATLGLDDTKRRQSVAEAMVTRKLSYKRQVLAIISTPDLLLKSETWRATTFNLLAALVEARQRDGWPLHHEFEKALGAENEAEFSPDYDEAPRFSTFNSHDCNNPVVKLRVVLEQAAGELAVLPDATPFLVLTDQALATRFAALSAIPMLTLFDAIRDAAKQRDWHKEAIVRLLSDAAVTACESLDDVRRLLRLQLPADLDADSRSRVMDAIRHSELSFDCRVRELSDLREWGMLTADEVQALATAQKEGRLSEPVDPRTEVRFTVSRGDLPTYLDSKAVWPYVDDEEQVCLLRDWMKVSHSSTPASPLNSEFAGRLEAIKTVLSRPESRTQPWLGTVLGWCSQLVGSLRDHVCWLAQQKNESLHSQMWEIALDEHTPWWHDMVEAALGVLLSPVPQSHTETTLRRTLSWNSNDVIFCSLELLDAVLTIPSVSPFAELQARFIAAIATRWSDWPAYTKAAVLTSLSAWHFATFPKLRQLLTEIVESEDDPVIVCFAVEPLLAIADERRVPEVRTVLHRAQLGGHDESLDRAAQLLGTARISVTQGVANESESELSQVLDEFLACDWTDRSAQMHFLNGVLFGALKALGALSEERQCVYEAWLCLVKKVVERWPFEAEVSGRVERFPLHAICSVIEAEPSVELKTSLFLQLLPVFKIILRLGAVSAFCQLHSDLKDMISGTQTPIHGKEMELPGILATGGTEQAFVELCKCSMERVVCWRQEGETTDDLGWISGLRGEESVELIKRCMAAAGDRERLRRELLPLVDALATAAQPELAADLRVFFRKLAT